MLSSMCASRAYPFAWSAVEQSQIVCFKQTPALYSPRQQVLPDEQKIPSVCNNIPSHTIFWAFLLQILEWLNIFIFLDTLSTFWTPIRNCDFPMKLELSLVFSPLQDSGNLEAQITYTSPLNIQSSLEETSMKLGFSFHSTRIKFASMYKPWH